MVEFRGVWVWGGENGWMGEMVLLTIPVGALGAKEFEDVDAAAAVGGLKDD